MRPEFCACSLFFLVFIRCSRPEERRDLLFQPLSSSQTNITFVNSITDNDSINILTYEYLHNGGGVGVLDVNNDGLSDLFFTGNQVPSTLYLNKGNFRFQDISASAGIQLKGEWCTGVSVVDINADGSDDLYVCIAGLGNKSVFPNKLFINQRDQTFKKCRREVRFIKISVNCTIIILNHPH